MYVIMIIEPYVDETAGGAGDAMNRGPLGLRVHALTRLSSSCILSIKRCIYYLSNILVLPVALVV